MTILIVDDDAAIRDAYARLLEREGFEVVAVDNGLAAFAAVQRQEFEALLCDVQMPFLEGRGLYEEIRQDYPLMAQRLAFVTAWADDDRVRQSLEATGRPVLRKPVEFADLIAVVRRLAEHPG